MFRWPWYSLQTTDNIGTLVVVRWQQDENDKEAWEGKEGKFDRVHGGRQMMKKNIREG